MSRVIDAGIEGNSHVFFVTGERTAIVDTGAPGNERRILRALKAAGIPQESVSILIVTHAHWDHCGSLHGLKAALKAPIMAGLPDASYLERGENAPAMSLPSRKDTAGPRFDPVKVDVAVDAEMSLRSYGIDASVITTPGHTAGSISVLVDNGDCATGDFLASMYTAEPAVFARSLKMLIDGNAKRFYPAHGSPVDAEATINRFYS